ncbi:MAG: replication-associated recombination protein A [Eubacteriaceae bacterium]|jgi:putative ATPase|nr:replication-associated recombination protein A [Eubacteriaceae bacterium]
MQNSFFDLDYESRRREKAPLAERMRPKSLDRFVGQEAIVGKGRQLYRMVEADKISSIILHGPPGSGKTTIANIIAETTKCEFVRLNATSSGASDIREAIREAKARLGQSGKGTILFVDEIHRFNKAQQDALLPSVENGTISLIGATTENPYFEVNAALISRSQVFRLEKLSASDICRLLFQAMEDSENGFGQSGASLEIEAAGFIAQASDGDARIALNALEIAYLSIEEGEAAERKITLKDAEDSIQKKAVLYDKAGDAHFDTVSAFIKSLRGSDPDAAVYWLAKMLYAGEDPKFIARRMIIFSSEDIGNAEPHALPLAIACFQAVEVIGLPECRLNLAQCATFLASCPKSNASAEAVMRALEDVESKPLADVPIHLRSSGASGYVYPHPFPKHWTSQEYLPHGFLHAPYYEPSNQGHEKRIAQFLQWIRTPDGEPYS